MVAKQKRRTFLQNSAVGAAALSMAAAPYGYSKKADKPALLGGAPIRSKGYTDWPKIEENDRKTWDKVLEKRGWCRLDGDYAKTFEKCQIDGGKRMFGGIEWDHFALRFAQCAGSRSGG